MSFSKDNSNYTETARLTEPEEEFDPYRLQEKPVPRQFRLVRRGLWFHLMGWPVLVVLAQLFLQALGWGFLVAIQYQGQIALPFSTAEWAENNPHIVTLVATLVSTVLAAGESYFFSYALRRSMSLYLLRPMSLAALGASVNIAMRSLVFHRRHWKWPAVSLLFFIMAGIQTPVWSTLITPVRVVISTPLVGHEIDLESPILQQMYNTGTFDVCQRAGRDGAVYGGVPESGYANGETYLGLPAAVSLLSRGFNVSTRGILAAILNDTHVGSWSIPGTVQMQGSRPKGISDTYSMSQQGFTAYVSCTVQTLTNDTTSPTVSWYIDSVKKWGTDLPRPNITHINVSSNCTSIPPVLSREHTDAYVSADGECLWAVGCDPTPEASDNYSNGNYTDLTGRSETSYLVCQIAPKVTIVRADYAGEINVSLMESPESAGTPTVAAGGVAGFFAMYIITDFVWHQQGITVNGVADQLVELSENIADDERFKIESYLRGVIEYSASILRAYLSADGLTFAGGVPSNITRPTSGTWTTQTLGWKQFSSATTLGILIPGIFMFCSTLTLVVVTIYRHRGEIYSDHTQIFDPSDPLHLIAAAAAGGST
ncbi:hypothetical protein B0H14DRAFT_3001280, partial [Mycena olivaceomarginata]